MPHLEIAEVALVHYNIVNNDYQNNSSKLYTFVLNKSFGQLLNYQIFHQNFNSDFSYIEVWFIDQESKPLKMKDKINISLLIKL